MNATAFHSAVRSIAVVLLLVAATSPEVHAQTLGGSDGKQFYTLDADAPFEGVSDGWNQKMSITDLSVVDGNWLLSMTADNLMNATNIGQSPRVVSSWDEATSLIGTMWNDDSYITAWAYRNANYAIVFSSDIGYEEQKYDWKGSFSDYLALLDTELRAGWSITEALYDGTDWIAVFSKGPRSPGAGQFAREVSSCSDLSNAGAPVQLIAQGDGRAVAVFGNGSDWHHAYGTQSIGTHASLDDLGAFIADQKRSGYLITSVAQLGGQWCAAASKGLESNSGNLRTDGDESGTVSLPTCNACDFFEKLAGKTCC